MKVTFIEHSGFCVELEKTVLIFDYYKGNSGDAKRKKFMFFFSQSSGSLLPKDF